MEYRIIIPARYASSRFPGKALAELQGRPLIEHVFSQATRSGASDVVVATDDQRIADAASGFGADVEMTRADHPSGTDRIFEVVHRRNWAESDIVVNLQGDAPLIAPGSIDQVARILHEHAATGIATLCTPLHEPSEYADRNVVKVVSDHDGRALYFSRASIPATAHGGDNDDAWRHAYRHVGLYAYRVGALTALAAAGPCALEQQERLEQLRALWLGIEIRVEVAAAALGPDVDTPEDLVAASRYLDQRQQAGD